MSFLLKSYWSPVVCLLVAVIFLVVAGELYSRKIFSDAKNEKDCTAKNSNGVCVAVWDDAAKVCKKAHAEGSNSCVSNSSTSLMVVGSLGLLLLIAGLIWLVVVFFQRRQKA